MSDVDLEFLCFSSGQMSEEECFKFITERFVTVADVDAELPQ
jgi:hypothetical protein